MDIAALVNIVDMEGTDVDQKVLNTYLLAVHKTGRAMEAMVTLGVVDDPDCHHALDVAVSAYKDEADKMVVCLKGLGIPKQAPLLRSKKRASRHTRGRVIDASV